MGTPRRRTPVQTWSLPQLDEHLQYAEQVIEEASLYIWDVLQVIDTVAPNNAARWAERVHRHAAEHLQPQLDDLARYLQNPCAQCGQPVTDHKGLPLTLYVEHTLGPTLQAQLIARGYNPEEDGLIHDDCWPAFKRMLKAKAARPVEASRGTAR